MAFDRAKYLAENERGRREMKLTQRSADRITLRQHGDSVRVRFLRLNDRLGYPVELHSSVGPDQSRVLCTRSVGQKCYICDRIEQMLAKDPNNQTAKRRAARTEGIFPVIDMDDPEKIKILRLPTGSCNELYRLAASAEAFALDSLEIGRVITVSYPDADKKPYGLKPDQEITEVDPSVLGNVPDLSKAYRPLTYEQQRVLWDEGWKSLQATFDSSGTNGDRDVTDVDGTETDVTDNQSTDAMPFTPDPPKSVAKPPLKLGASKIENKPTAAALAADLPGQQIGDSASANDKPECFGLAWEADDPMCQSCLVEQQCIPVFQKAQAYKEKVKKAKLMEAEGA